jgi:catalase
MATTKRPRSSARTSNQQRTRDQQGAKGRLVTQETEAPVRVPRGSKVPAQDSDFLTTAHGQRVSSTDDSLTAGARGPTLLEDFHLREKVMHFDHERIPERVVHARGAAAHGVFEAYDDAAALSIAGFLQPGTVTPVFTRFSTVLGSRGSADTVRDVRGFAVKFYTDEGVFDLVGNNIPVFFIRDGIKFPDLIHAGKPEPDREIPQAQTAHTTFWDFVSMIPESPHMLMWVMSDRAIPRSYRMMEGFGVHTFRLVNDAGETALVKFHWKPVLGVHGLVWDEALTLNGVDPDFHRRDLYNAIGAGAYPEWDLGVQVMPDSEDERFEGIDLLDSTKLVPEELCPVQVIGRLTLNRNPTNFFAEVEQVAFHAGHLVRGIDIVDDPLLHARLFSYLDTQLTRLGGPNFSQIPINRPHAPVNDNHRDGFMQQAVHHGRTPYLPNQVGGGCPFLAGEADGGYEHVPRPVQGTKTRERPPDDPYAQAALFWSSMTEVEQDHIVDAYTFELGKVDVPAVVERMVARLALIDEVLARRVCVGLGLPGPLPPDDAAGAVPQDEDVPDQTGGIDASPALSMVTENTWPVDARVVQILACDGADLVGVRAVQDAVIAAGAVPHVVAPHKGAIVGVDGADQLTVDRSFHTASSAEADALVVAAGTAPLSAQAGVLSYVQSAHRHHKAIGAWGDGSELLASAAIDPAGPGMVVVDDPAAAGNGIVAAMAVHRAWDRAPVHPTRDEGAGPPDPAGSRPEGTSGKKAAKKAAGKKTPASKKAAGTKKGGAGRAAAPARSSTKKTTKKGGR